MSRMKFFIELTASEEAMFRHWAREHYVPFSLINGTWHWVTQDECVQINRRTLSTTFQLPQSPIEPALGIQNAPPEKIDPPVKRGPGRPRKILPASPEPAPSVAPGPRITDRSGAARIIGKSLMTIKRMEKQDPDWPKPFAVGSIYKNSYLIADIDAYLAKKASDSLTKQPPTPSEIRKLANLIPIRAKGGGEDDAGATYPVGHGLPEQFLMFDQLPDDSLVDVHVVALLFGCAVATAWRRVREGLLPQPEHLGGTTRWRVSVLRVALARPRTEESDHTTVTKQARAALAAQAAIRARKKVPKTKSK